MAPRQDRVELKGSARSAFPSGQDVGPADPNQQIEVSVLLRRGSKPGDFPAADQMGSRLPRDRKYLTREEFAKQYGASPADIEKVRAFATQYDLKVASEDRASRTVKLTGTVQAFNDAFGANLRRYEHSSGSYRCRTGALTIPADLDGIIEGVLGLDNRPQAKPHFRLRKKNSSAQPNATDVSYSPLQVAKAYAFPSGATGSGQCIALIELGGGYNASDLTHGRLQRPRRRSGTRHRSRRCNRTSGADRGLFRAKYRSRLHRRRYHRRPRRDAQAFHHFHQLGRPGRFLDGPISQRSQFRLSGRLHDGCHSPRSFGR